MKANALTRTFHRAGLKMKKHAPSMLIALGVTGTVASAVLACKATTKAGAIVEDFHKDMEKVREAQELAKENEIEYTQADVNKDTTIVYAHAAVRFFKLYAPSAALGALSIACILTSHNIMNKRNASIAAAYAAVDGSFKKYRERVAERFGDDLEKEIRYDIRAKEVTEEIVDEETGEKRTETKIVRTADITYSPYAKIFDEGCLGHTMDPEANRKFLILQENFANERLKARGHLFLNEVYEMLDFEISPDGQSIGWIYDPDVEHKVSFGLYEFENEQVREFFNNREHCIILDFNVDGNILKYI